MVHDADAVVPVLTRLVQGDKNGHRLGLEIAARLPLPLDPETFPLLQPLLPDARFPRRCG